MAPRKIIRCDRCRKPTKETRYAIKIRYVLFTAPTHKKLPGAEVYRVLCAACFNNIWSCIKTELP